MNCPYCGKEMEPRMLTSVRELTWWKAGKRRKTSIYPPNQEGSVVLSEMSFLNGSAVEAYLCRECQKIIIDYTDGKCDLNNK